jgi:hypothetical protein
VPYDEQGASIQRLKMGKQKGSSQRTRPPSVTRKDLGETLPTSVQKSYFMLSDPVRTVLNTALENIGPVSLSRF